MPTQAWVCHSEWDAREPPVGGHKPRQGPRTGGPWASPTVAAGSRFDDSANRGVSWGWRYTVVHAAGAGVSVAGAGVSVGDAGDGTGDEAMSVVADRERLMPSNAATL